MKSICKKMISMMIALALVTGFVQTVPDVEAASKPTFAKSAVFDDDMIKQFAAVIQKMIEDRAQHGIAFHCTYGKNRTGIMAALILALLGVDEETIFNDYLLSSEFVEGDLDTDALNISYKEEGTDGECSAIFLHCFDYKPFTGGCVAIAEPLMKTILQKLKPDCQIVMGENLKD